ncbi:MAG: thiamine phosphate synthase [bacterium]|jgi:thiamine-phosphate pyrophosphorylase
MKTLNFQIITKDFNLNEEIEYLENIANVAVKSSAGVLQLRNKKISAHSLYNSALFLKKILGGFNNINRPALIINDRPDIAYMTGADGVHIGQDDIPAADVKKLFPGMIIGVSSENIEQAVQAEKNGADYIGAGPIYPTGSKQDAGDSMKRETLTEMCKTVKIPVIAIGGITELNIKELAVSGVSGVAVISAVSNAENPLNEALKFRKNIDEYLKQ